MADQLKDLKIFLEKNTGKTISEDRLKERLACSKRTLENYKKYQQLRADRYVPSDLVTPLYAGMTNNILLGTAEEEKYTQMLLEDIKKATGSERETHLLDAYHSILVGCSAPGALLQ